MLRGIVMDVREFNLELKIMEFKEKINGKMA